MSLFLWVLAETLTRSDDCGLKSVTDSSELGFIFKTVFLDLCASECMYFELTDLSVKSSIWLCMDWIWASIADRVGLLQQIKGVTSSALQILDSQLSQGVSLNALSGWPNLGLPLPPAWAAWCYQALWKGPLWCGTEASLSYWWWSRLVTADTHFPFHKKTFT